MCADALARGLAFLLSGARAAGLGAVLGAADAWAVADADADADADATAGAGAGAGTSAGGAKAKPEPLGNLSMIAETRSAAWPSVTVSPRLRASRSAAAFTSA